MDIVGNINTLLDSFEETSATETEISSINHLLESFSNILRKPDTHTQFSINDMNDMLDSFGIVLSNTEKIVLSKSAMTTRFSSRNKIEELIENMNLSDTHTDDDDDSETSEKANRKKNEIFKKAMEKKPKWKEYECTKTQDIPIPKSGTNSKIQCIENKKEKKSQISSVQIEDDGDDNLFDLYADSTNELYITRPKKKRNPPKSSKK
jgi:hypothetical protein